MHELQTLSKPKLVKTHQELSHYFYKNKTNIGLEHALQSSRFYDFVNDVQVTLKHQVYPFTKRANIEEILKQVNKASDRDWMSAIAILFIAFSDAFPLGEKALLFYLIWGATEGGRDALGKLGATDTHFAPNSTLSRGILDSRMNFLETQIDQTTMLWVIDLLQDGVLKGQDATEIALSIQAAMDDMVIRRGNVIAETETANAYGQFQLQTFKENGVTMIRWVTAHDERTCPICSGNEEEGDIPIGRAFQSGTTAPPAHILCRCYIENVDGGGEINWRG